MHNGDSTTAIGQTLQDHGVVATSKAFVDAAAGNAAISAIQPGFYKVRTEIPAAECRCAACGSAEPGRTAW